MDDQPSPGNPTSTHCRFCGCEDGAGDAREVREKSHVQVVVSCGSCGRPFAMLSRN